MNFDLRFGSRRKYTRVYFYCQQKSLLTFKNKPLFLFWKSYKQGRTLPNKNSTGKNEIVPFYFPPQPIRCFLLMPETKPEGFHKTPYLLRSSGDKKPLFLIFPFSRRKGADKKSLFPQKHFYLASKFEELRFRYVHEHRYSHHRMEPLGKKCVPQRKREGEGENSGARFSFERKGFTGKGSHFLASVQGGNGTPQGGHVESIPATAATYLENFSRGRQPLFQQSMKLRKICGGVPSCKKCRMVVIEFSGFRIHHGTSEQLEILGILFRENPISLKNVFLPFQHTTRYGFPNPVFSRTPEIFRYKPYIFFSFRGKIWYTLPSGGSFL